jgi:serine/threonine-protein kinase RsbW
MHDTASSSAVAPVQTLDLAAPPDDVDSVHGLLESVWGEHEHVSSVDRISFETALIELSSNVIRHGDGGSGIRCSLTVSVSGDRIEARLIDSGVPGRIELDQRRLPDDDFAESGRGIPLITALVDVVHYERCDGANHWYLARTLAR